MDTLLDMPPCGTDLLHIMLVDDEDDYHFITRLMLKKAGFRGRLTAYLEPEEALGHLRSGEKIPDLLFVDINMPATDGFQFLDHCKAEALLNHEATSVIMCSSSNRPLDMDKAREVGFVREYIEKPLTPEQFNRIAIEHMNRS